MPPPTSIECVGRSLQIVLKKIRLSDAKFGARIGKSRQWVYKLTRGLTTDTGVENIDRMAAVLSEECGRVITPADLFQPERIEAMLDGKVGVTKPFTPSSKTDIRDPPHVADLTAQIDSLQSSRAALHSALFDIATALRRYIDDGTADSGHVRSVAPPVPKAPRPGRKRR